MCLTSLTIAWPYESSNNWLRFDTPMTTVQLDDTPDPKQWPAVMTYWSLIIAPPHVWNPLYKDQNVFSKILYFLKIWSQNEIT